MVKFNLVLILIRFRYKWFEERHQQLETLEAQLRRLQASLEGLYAHRRELAYATAALGKGLALLSNGEDHTGLSRALAKMAELHDKVSLSHSFCGFECLNEEICQRCCHRLWVSMSDLCLVWFFQLEGVHNEQSDADFYILHELLKDYLSLLGVVKVVHCLNNNQCLEWRKKKNGKMEKWKNGKL